MCLKAQPLVEGESTRIGSGNLKLDGLDPAASAKFFDMEECYAAKPLASVTSPNKKVGYSRLGASKFEVKAERCDDVSDGAMSMSDKPCSPERVVAEQPSKPWNHLLAVKWDAIEPVITLDQCEQSAELTGFRNLQEDFRGLARKCHGKDEQKGKPSAAEVPSAADGVSSERA